MDMKQVWMTQRQPTPPEDPGPQGEESERVDIDEDVETQRSPSAPRRPTVPEPATPDANPIDPRVFHRT